MAIVVPFLIGSTAAGAAMAAAVGLSTTALATITSVAFAVTGINDKINKAAANVFGEDLVKVANLAGMAYGVYNGGFDISGGASAAAGAAELASTTPELTSSAWDAMGAADTAALDSITSAAPAATNVVNTVSSMEPAISDLASAPTVAPPPAAPNQLSLAKMADPIPKTITPAATETTSIVNPLRASAGPGFNATNNATTSQFSPGYNASAPNAAAGNATAPATSFMDKLKNMATSPQIVTGAIQGAAGAYSSSQQRAQQQAELDKREARAKLGANGWKQTFRTA